MAPQFDRQLRELLKVAGCYLVRQGRGSHDIWHSPITWCGNMLGEYHLITSSVRSFHFIFLQESPSEFDVL